MRDPFMRPEEEIDPVTGLPKTPNPDLSSILAPAAPVEPNMSIMNESVDAPAPSTEAPAPEVNVRDYLMKKYGLDSKYSAEARENTIKDNEMGIGQGLMAAISAIGAGYQGKDSGAAASNMLSGFKKNADSKISQFDSARQQALQNVDTDRRLAKEDRDDKDYASRNDPMSELSIAKREAFKNAYGVDIPDTISASKLDELSPILSKKIDMDLARQNREQDQLNKDREFGLKETELGLKREAAAERSSEDKLTEGQKVVDREFAKEYNEWTSGGAKTARSEIEKLKGVAQKIRDGKVSLGRENALIPDFLADGDRLAARADVQSTVMNSLRAILGAQFTEKEGERIIKNTWNENESEENNLARIERLISDLENQANDKDAKAAHYEQYGSLNQFKASPSEQKSKEEIKEINGKRYRKVQGGWEEI